MTPPDRIGMVVIGRNEGERLKASLRSLAGMAHIAYVDSGSTDGSQDFAKAQGVTVVTLPVPPKFTAARARNAGIDALLAETSDLELMQMVDGDCTVEPGWIATAAAALDADSGLAGVFGRLREVAPERSLYNRLCDIEWDGPVGPSDATGGNAMFRIEALRAVDGYDAGLIAGEEPDMCLRMGELGWRFARIDAPMGRHDADISRFGQWWRRAVRAGYAATEHVGRHGFAALHGDVVQVERLVLWGFAIPATGLGCALRAFWDPRFLIGAGLVSALYLFKIARQAARERPRLASARQALATGVLRQLHQFAAFRGFLSCCLDHLRRRERGIIEYR